MVLAIVYGLLSTVLVVVPKPERRVAARLKLGLAKVDRAGIDPGRRAGLEADKGEAKRGGLLPEPHSRGLTGPPCAPDRLACDRSPTQECAGCQDERATLEGAARMSKNREPRTENRSI